MGQGVSLPHVEMFNMAALFVLVSYLLSFMIETKCSATLQALWPSSGIASMNTFLVNVPNRSCAVFHVTASNTRGEMGFLHERTTVEPEATKNKRTDLAVLRMVGGSQLFSN